MTPSLPTALVLTVLLLAGCATEYDAVAPTDKPYGIITFEREEGKYSKGLDVINYKRPRDPIWTLDGLSVYGAFDGLDKSIRAKLGQHLLAPEGKTTPTLLITVEEGVIHYITDYVDEYGWGYKLFKEERDPAYGP